MILGCITAIIIVTIICITFVVNSYISKKAADYKAALKKREDFMSTMGVYIDKIDSNIKCIDTIPNAKSNIESLLSSVKYRIFKYCDNID